MTTAAISNPAESLVLERARRIVARTAAAWDVNAPCADRPRRHAAADAPTRRVPCRQQSATAMAARTFAFAI